MELSKCLLLITDCLIGSYFINNYIRKLKNNEDRFRFIDLGAGIAFIMYPLYYIIH